MRDSLDRSMDRVLLSYAGLQILVFAAFGLPAGFFLRYAPGFLAACLLFHAFLRLVLGLLKSEFALAEDGARLERVNLANVITLFRVSSLPTLLFLVVASKDHLIRYPLLALVFVVFASDFVDGWISRSRKQVTRIGKMLDSGSDYAVLVVLTVAFWYFHFVDDWFFWLVTGRLALQALFQALVFAIRGRVRPRSTFMGKAAIASVMLVYGMVVLRLLAPVGLAPVLFWMQVAAGAVVAVSVVDKVLAFAEDLRAADKT